VVAGNGTPLVVHSSGTNFRFHFDVPTKVPTYITLQITATNPSDSVHAIRLVLPGFEFTYDNQDLFHPKLLQALRPFSVLRFMDVMSTNFSTQEKWAYRPHAEDQSQGGSPRSNRGMALEYMLELCNRADASPWFTMPHRADDDYVLQFATMVHDRLRPDLDVYVEYSNETWNPFFSQNAYCVTQGFAAGFDSAPTQLAGDRWHAHRIREMAEMFRSIFGAGADRVVCVNAGQFSSFEPARLTWEGIDRLPNVKYGVSPYFGTKQSEAEILAGGTQGVLDATEARLKDVVIPLMADTAVFAESHHHKLVIYEYNTNYIVSRYSEPSAAIRAQLLQIFTQANDDPRMKGFFRDLWLPGLKAAGGQISAAFELTSNIDEDGDFGLIRDLDVIRTTRYDGILEFERAQPRWW